MESVHEGFKLSPDAIRGLTVGQHRFTRNEPESVSVMLDIGTGPCILRFTPDAGFTSLEEPVPVPM